MEGHRNESGGECLGGGKKKECPSVSLEAPHFRSGEEKRGQEQVAREVGWNLGRDLYQEPREKENFKEVLNCLQTPEGLSQKRGNKCVFWGISGRGLGPRVVEIPGKQILGQYKEVFSSSWN